jgi:hypothetical protein
MQMRHRLPRGVRHSSVAEFCDVSDVATRNRHGTVTEFSDESAQMSSLIGPRGYFRVSVSTSRISATDPSRFRQQIWSQNL